MKAAFALLFVSLLLSLPADAQIAVKGETVWTMNGSPITNGVVLISNGKIEAVGAASSIKIPSGYRVISAKVVTPGLIDAHSVVGLNGYLNQPHDQMALDGGGPIQPELRAIDAYNADERLIEWIRGFGVTTIHTGHQPSALISGQTMIAKTVGKDVDEVTINPLAMIAATLGQDGLAGKAQENSKKADPPKDLRSDIMIKVIRREVPLLVTANKVQDISAALRIAKEFNIRIVLDGGAEAPFLIDQILAGGVGVILHPPLARPGGEE